MIGIFVYIYYKLLGFFPRHLHIQNMDWQTSIEAFPTTWASNRALSIRKRVILPLFFVILEILLSPLRQWQDPKTLQQFPRLQAHQKIERGRRARGSLFSWWFSLDHGWYWSRLERILKQIVRFLWIIRSINSKWSWGTNLTKWVAYSNTA